MADDRVTVIKRGDTAPDLGITLLDGDAPIDLSNASGIRILGRRRSAPLFDKTVTGTAAGEVTLVWETDDTAVTGSINVEVEVTWPDGKIQTFPATGYLRVEVRQDLG